MTSGTWVEIATMAVPAIMAITLHEAAHGYAALALGDDTARRMRRLSINPLRHVDPVGTILVPAMLLLSHVGFVFGWAKPVPVDPRAFADPRRGMAIVAAAGPAANFSLAFLTAVLLRFDLGTDATAELITGVLSSFIIFNLALGLFNLLPIPPLDGGRIAVWLLPLPLARVWARFERFGVFVVLLGIVVLPRLLGVDPVGAVLGRVLPWAFDLVLRAAGHAPPPLSGYV